MHIRKFADIFFEKDRFIYQNHHILRLCKSLLTKEHIGGENSKVGAYPLLPRGSTFRKLCRY